MKSATYGRMQIGRCITAKEVEAHRLVVGDDPRYFGCSTNILSIMDRKCSGNTECDVHVIDLSLEDLEPCFPGLSSYIEVTYDCISGGSIIHSFIHSFIQTIPSFLHSFIHSFIQAIPKAPL